MARSKRGSPDRAGVYLEAEIINSRAFQTLSGTEIRVLLRFYQRRDFRSHVDPSRRQIKVLVNNGEIDFSFVAAEKEGFSRSTFMRCRNKLVKVGFIDIAQTGAGMYRSLNLYAISDRWKKYGTPDFKEAERPKRPRFKEGIGFQKGHEAWGKRRKS